MREIIAVVILSLIGIVILYAIVLTIKDYKTNKERKVLVAQQLDKLQQLQHQPLSNELTKQFFDSQLKSDHSVSTDARLLALILQNRTGFYGA